MSPRGLGLPARELLGDERVRPGERERERERVRGGEREPPLRLLFPPFPFPFPVLFAMPPATTAATAAAS